jgi:hypothetical protein
MRLTFGDLVEQTAVKLRDADTVTFGKVADFRLPG